MYVYFITHQHPRLDSVNVVKIGKARNPHDRMSEIQVGSSERLRLMGMIRCKSDAEAYKLERFLHDLLRRQRMHGEWFNLRKSQMRMIKRVMRTANEAADADMRANEMHAELDREFDAIIGRRA